MTAEVNDTLQEQESAKKERHVEFVGVDSDKETEGNQSYICKVVGGVVQKIPVDSKGSPTQSPGVIRRPKTGRKKVDRRVSCKDLGKGDCEGWLYKRKARGGGPLFSHWQKRWCVIKDYNMFCYHDEESLKAEVVIHLPAFKVSPVDQHTDFKTKKRAFKIHNSGTSFYFASERQEDMSKWMNKMGLAAITFTDNEFAGIKKPYPGKYIKDHPEPDYSESDEEDPCLNQLSPANKDCSPYSSTSSLHSICSRTQELRAPSPDLRASQEDLSVMIRKQSQRGQNLYGEDLNKQRRSALSKDIEENISPEVMKFRKVKCLERTLKAKEKELEEIEALLSGLSHAKLQVYRELHDTQSET